MVLGWHLDNLTFYCVGTILLNWELVIGLPTRLPNVHVHQLTKSKCILGSKKGKFSVLANKCDEHVKSRLLFCVGEQFPLELPYWTVIPSSRTPSQMAEDESCTGPVLKWISIQSVLHNIMHTLITPLLYNQSDPFGYHMVITSQFYVSLQLEY